MDAAGSQTDAEPTARIEALALGAGRLLLGIGIVAATRPALAGLGFKDPSEATVAVARLAGVRDIAMGAYTLLAAGDRERLRQSVALGALVDTGDALTFAAGMSKDEAGGALALRNVPFAGAAALAGLRTLRRL